MKKKIYTTEHQKLYDQLRDIRKNEQVKSIIDIELKHLLDRCKDIRKDYGNLAKLSQIDSIYTDLFFQNRKKIYSIEHLIVKNDKIYILERKRKYDNQVKLLKDKVAFIRKLLGVNIDIEFYVLMDVNTARPNHISIQKFIEKICTLPQKETTLIDIVDKFILNNHKDLTIKQYLFYKYKLDIDKIDIKIKKQNKKKALKYNLLSIIPFLSPKEKKISFIGSVVLMLYILCVALTYYTLARTSSIAISLIIDFFIFMMLKKTIEYMDDNLPKVLNIGALIACILILTTFISKILYFT